LGTLRTLHIERLVVIGTGLIGGSFALALKRAAAVGEVVGISRKPETLEQARRLGVIDRAGGYDQASFAGAQLVLVATPVGQMDDVFRAISPLLPRETVVTDGGSTKQDVIALANRHFAGSLERFVPGHPVAGTEKSGPEAAFPELFQDRRVVLTPMAQTGKAAQALVRAAWEACGARVSDMAAEEHDAILAAVSHLPHLLAFALVDEFAQRPNAERAFSFSGGGFRDFTRIASSSPEMWRDIFLSNRHAVSAELQRYRDKLAVVQKLLDAGAAEELEALFERSRSARARLL
jgi:prephenate dehydrogenase